MVKSNKTNCFFTGSLYKFTSSITICNTNNKVHPSLELINRFIKHLKNVSFFTEEKGSEFKDRLFLNFW